jgi:hypothetical protein
MNALARPPSSHIAQINVSRALFDLDDPRMSGFTGAIDAINAIAERSTGFVWRLKSDSGNALDIRVDDDPRFIINMSVWESAEALEQFVWRTAHARVYSRKAQWFPHPGEANLALWWVEPGTMPTAGEGMARLERLRAHGPGPDAFGWEQLESVAVWRAGRCGQVAG